jgi:hypothetical protein
MSNIINTISEPIETLMNEVVTLRQRVKHLESLVDLKHTQYRHEMLGKKIKYQARLILKYKEALRSIAADDVETFNFSEWEFQSLVDTVSEDTEIAREALKEENIKEDE